MFVLALSAVVLLCGASSAFASGRQVGLFEDDDALLSNPVATLQELRHLGVTMVRVNVRWSEIAPDPNSRRRPKFKASDPDAYSARKWAPYDAVVQAADAAGIQLMFTPTAFAPLWAQGANPARYGAHYNSEFAFMPAANEFKQFVEALGKRYPGVRTWELYNEPNFGEDLAPQAINHSNVLYSPVMYRALVGAAWSALRATGHGRDTIIIGALAAHGAHRGSASGFGLPGAYGETPPLEFIREVYCLDASYQPYHGTAAGIRKCPTSRAASRRFRAQNPALFSAAGWSIHPYPLGADGGTPPTRTTQHNPDFAGFSQLPNMIRTLDRIQRVYRSGKRFPLWNTEYGYITNPPNRSEHYMSPTTAAYYDNWAEYLSWRNPRIASAMQYLLYDPNPSVGTPECGGFASGLVFFPARPTTNGCAPYPPGTAKPTLDAYRLPIYLPKSSARRGQSLTIWGCVRPAHYAILDAHQPQTALIQFQRHSRGGWVNLATVTFRSSSSSCYFTRRVRFRSSGSVRLLYGYPANDPGLGAGIPKTGFRSAVPTASRAVRVTVR